MVWKWQQSTDDFPNIALVLKDWEDTKEINPWSVFQLCLCEPSPFLDSESPPTLKTQTRVLLPYSADKMIKWNLLFLHDIFSERGSIWNGRHISIWTAFGHKMLEDTILWF